MKGLVDPRAMPHEAQTKQDAPEDSSEKGSSTWIAEVSHELRLPIANIKLLVETLLDGALEDPAICRRMLKRAYSEVDRLQALVKDLLSVESVSESRQELKCQWVKLQERALYAAESVATTAVSKGVAVEVRVPPKFQVFANPEQLDQVLLNLVENAVKFTPAGGTVAVDAGPQPGLFSVSDTGIGMPAAEIPKIFQRFYRIDRSASKGSTGLGLSIVKNIVELHGAQISVESEEGKGSTFRLQFPAPQSRPPEGTR